MTKQRAIIVGIDQTVSDSTDVIKKYLTPDKKDLDVQYLDDKDNNYGDKEEVNDNSYSVTQPKYYKAGKRDLIAFAKEHALDFLQFYALRYIVRHKGKNGKEDLLKAQEVIKRMLEDYD